MYNNEIFSLCWTIPQVPYKQAWSLQLAQVNKIAAGKALPTVFFLEHHPVITIGKRGNKRNLLVSEEILTEAGIECVEIDRGGDITFHGPGQLVVYLLFPLRTMEKDVHRFLRRIEEIGICVLADYNLKAGRISGYTGVWAGGKKIMAIGIGVKKGVSFHGLAFNYLNNLSGFEWIVPCGIQEKGVTSLHLLINRKVTRKEIEEKFKIHIAREFGLKLSHPVNPLEEVQDENCRR